MTILIDLLPGCQPLWPADHDTVLFFFQDANRSGLLIRGNLRDERDKVFKHVCDKVAEVFPDRWVDPNPPQCFSPQFA